MDKNKQILVVGESGTLGDLIVEQLIAQGLHVKVSGKDWCDAPYFLQGIEGRKSRYGEALGLGGIQTDVQDETTYLPHTAARLHDTTTGTYVSANKKEDASSVDIRKDAGIRAASGCRTNAYKQAVYDPEGKIDDLGGEFKHKEWEKDASSGKSEKKPSGAGQARYATETGSFVAEFMCMVSDPIAAGQETPGHQTIEESTWDNMKGCKDLVNPREHVDRGGAVDYGPSASVCPPASTGSREQLKKGRQPLPAESDTAFMPHTAARLHDTSTGHYVAETGDTAGVDIRKDAGIRAASGCRTNAYKQAVYDPEGKIEDLGGEFKHKEWEKDTPSGKSQKKSTEAPGAGQARYATETGSFVAEFMCMASGPIAADQETPGHQTIEESTWDNMKGCKDLVNPREHVDRGGAVDYGPSASTVSIGSGKRETASRAADTACTAYVKFDRSLDKKEHLNSAFEGVDGLLILGYSPTQDMCGTAKMLFEAAKEKGIGHVVCLSMQGAAKKTGVPHLESMRDMEECLRNSGLSYTILRIPLYMECFLSDKSLSSLREGRLELPLSPDCKVDLVSAADVGHVAAEAFQVPRKLNGKEIDLVADRLSVNEIASAIGKTFSMPVECRKTGSLDFQGTMNDHFQWMEKTDVHGDIGQTCEFLNRFNIQLTNFRDYLLEVKDTVTFDKAAKAA